MKIIKLTESDLTKIVKRVLLEQIIQGGPNDAWEYKKEGNNFYTRKKGASNWILTSGSAKNAIEKKIFSTLSKSSPIPDKQNQVKNNSSKIDIGITPNKVDTFTPYSRDTLKSTGDFIFKTFDEAIKMIGKMSKKTYYLLNDLKSKNKLKNKSFIIVNKDSAIASLFDSNYNFIGKSGIVTGSVKGKDDTIGKGSTTDEFINDSLEFWRKGKIKDSRIEKWVKNNPTLIDTTNKIKYDEYQKKLSDKVIDPFPVSFETRKLLGKNITPSGVFKVGQGVEKNYVGASGIINTFPLVDLKSGRKYSQAIHAYSDEKRGQLIKKSEQEDVDTLKDYTRIGAGCVNVDRNFILNIHKYKPEYVLILPDSGVNLDLSGIKTVTLDSWTKKIIEMGNNCVRSFYSIF